MLKKIIRASGATALALVMASAIWSTSAAAAEFDLRYSDIGPPRGPRAEALKWWAGELKTRSKDRIEVEFFWGQSLIKARDNLRALGSGLVETAQVIASYNAAELGLWNYASVPFGINDEWVGMRAWFEMLTTTPEALAEAKRNKFKLLANNTTGPVHLLCAKAPITTTAGLKGKKIRTTGGLTNLLKSLGAVPVTIGFGELYQALERGTVDCTQNYTAFVKSYKHYEVADHLTEAYMGQFLAYGIAMSLRTFDEMPKDLQDIMEQTSIEYMDVYARYQIEFTQQARKELIAGIDGKKVEVHKLSDAERAQWEAAAESFTTGWLAKMEKKGIDGQAYLDKLAKVTAKWEAKLKAEGYPWAKTN
jgi:TRAP-type C4-dicarboxylate transport system substrate-binding protein